MKTYNTSQIAQASNTNTSDVKKYLKRRGILPTQTMKVGARTYRLWGQDAYDWAVQYRQKKLATTNKEVSVEQLTLHLDGDPVPAVITPRNDEILQRLTNIECAVNALLKLWESK